MAEKGIFELRTAMDLFFKLERDLKRVKASPADSYAAFDFFVTAYHISDWKGCKKAFKGENLPQPDRATWEVCTQLANGSKHFEVRGTYDSVKGTKLADTAFQKDAFQSDAFQVGYLTVRLEATPALHLGGDSIRVDVLAERLVEFWRGRLEN